MALSRADLVGIVASEQHESLVLARLSDADQPGALKDPLDRCFRALGTPESGLATASVPDGGEQRAIAFATYFVLARATLALVGKRTMAAGRTRSHAREQYENVRERMREALAIAQGYGLALAGNGLSGLTPVPYAGGVALGDYTAREQDGDRVPPLFSRADLPPETGWPVEPCWEP